MSSDEKRPGKETKFIPGPDASVSAGQRRAGNLDNVSTEFMAAADDRVVARLSLIAGPGSGETRPVLAGTNSIGRDKTLNRIGLDLGDGAISRKGHAILVADAGAGTFRLFDGGKPNPVFLNGRILSGDLPVAIGDVIQIGDTQLKLIKA